MPEKIIYQWVKVAELQTGWHIHVDVVVDGTFIESDYRIKSIEPVGENVIEIRAAKWLHLDCPEMILHRKPTDEVSVFGVEVE